MIELLNHYFIPVTTSNDDYNESGPLPRAEKDARERIAMETRQTIGPSEVAAADVASYIVRPDGHVHSTIRLPRMQETAEILGWLKDAVDDLGTKRADQPAIKATRKSAPPRDDADALVLHLTTRYLFGGDGSSHAFPSGEGKEFDQWMKLVGNRLRAVSLLPTEDWITLAPAECAKLLGPEQAPVETKWTIDEAVARKLLRQFRPSTTNNDPTKNQVEETALNARLESIADSVARVCLEGKVRIKAPFTHFKDDDYYATSTLVGYIDYDVAKRKIIALRLVTDQAKYMGADFGAALRSNS